MLNKKSMGLHWDVLLISLFISIGILYYSIASVDIPKVGEISLEMIKTLEKNNLIPSIIERIMKWINEQTIKDLSENKIFKLRSYCGSEEYKGKISGSNQLLNGGFGYIEGNNSFCIIDEDDLVHYFEIIFEGNYNVVRSKDFDGDLDLSKTIYTSFVDKKNDEYFNTVNTSNGLEIPLKIKKDRKEKQIGKFIMKPVFRFPVDYAFDDPRKERCILSMDCTADCDDVMKAGYGGGIKENSCDYYGIYPGDCVVVKDDFEKIYPCDKGSFCEGNCCDNHCYDLNCGEPNDCGTPCGDRCDDDCPDASACGMCGNPECPPPEEEPSEQSQEKLPEESVVANE